MRTLFLTSALSSLVLAQGMALAQQSQEGYSTEQSSKESHPMESQKTVENVDLFFDTDSAELKSDAHAELQKLADWARCDSRNAVILEGFADPRGSSDHNQELSGKRAAEVRQALIQMGVPSQRIVISVYGENGPKLDSFAKERRVTARAAETPVTPEELSG